MVKQQIRTVGRNEFGEVWHVNSSTLPREFSDEQVQKLRTANIIGSESPLYHHWEVKNEEDITIGEIEFLEFSTDSIGYIRWLKVKQDYQQQGVGRTLRKEAVNYLSQVVDKIFTDISSEPAKRIARSQQFKRISSGTLAGWRVREVHS